MKRILLFLLILSISINSVFACDDETILDQINDIIDRIDNEYIPEANEVFADTREIENFIEDMEDYKDEIDYVKNYFEENDCEDVQYEIEDIQEDIIEELQRYSIDRSISHTVESTDESIFAGEGITEPELRVKKKVKINHIEKDISFLVDWQSQNPQELLIVGFYVDRQYWEVGDEFELDEHEKDMYEEIYLDSLTTIPNTINGFKAKFRIANEKDENSNVYSFEISHPGITQQELNTCEENYQGYEFQWSNKQCVPYNKNLCFEPYDFYETKAECEEDNQCGSYAQGFVYDWETEICTKTNENSCYKYNDIYTTMTECQEDNDLEITEDEPVVEEPECEIVNGFVYVGNSCIIKDVNRCNEPNTKVYSLAEKQLCEDQNKPKEQPLEIEEIKDEPEEKEEKPEEQSDEKPEERVKEITSTCNTGYAFRSNSCIWQDVNSNNCVSETFSNKAECEKENCIFEYNGYKVEGDKCVQSKAKGCNTNLFTTKFECEQTLETPTEKKEEEEAFYEKSYGEFVDGIIDVLPGENRKEQFYWFVGIVAVGAIFILRK